MILGQPVSVRPVDGRRVRMPGGKILPVSGDTVIACSYWLRRQNSGDIEEFVPDADEQQPVAGPIEETVTESVANVEETKPFSESVANAALPDSDGEVTHAG